MGLIIAIHVMVCILLLTIILIQSGRGGGLVDSFSGVESMFGTKTNSFLTKTTTILAVIFFLTCLSLAILSARQSKSLMKNIKTQQETPITAVPLQEKIKEEAATQVPTPQQQTPLPASPITEIPKAE
jgi:preprotein translocase subunit SecG